MLVTAPFPYNPYDALPSVPLFTVTSTDIPEDYGTLPPHCCSKLFGVEHGEDQSPQLVWKDYPSETKSFVITCYDPDAPTISGFWHWAMYDIPVSTTSIATGIPNSLCPGKQLHNDAGTIGYVGAAPPPNHGIHRYIFCVTALSVETLPIDTNVSNAVLQFNLFGAGIVVGRAFLTATFGR